MPACNTYNKNTRTINAAAVTTNTNTNTNTDDNNAGDNKCAARTYAIAQILSFYRKRFQ